MGKSPQIVNRINGRSWYDRSHSVYGTMTMGLLYPFHVMYVNAQDVVSMKPTFDIRTDPMITPPFNPLEVRLHRYFCPMRLYYKNLRFNNRNFDYSTIKFHYVRFSGQSAAKGETQSDISHRWYLPSGGLLDWLNLSPLTLRLQSQDGTDQEYYTRYNFDATSVAAYYDIVRNWYAYPSWNAYSVVNGPIFNQANIQTGDWWYQHPQGQQSIESLDSLDSFVDRFLASDVPCVLSLGGTQESANFRQNPLPWVNIRNTPSFSSGWSNYGGVGLYLSYMKCGLAVAPASPDGLSRNAPALASNAVTITSPITVSNLAMLAKVQSIKDVLAATGSRFTDFLFSMFGQSIPHMDIPSLLYTSRFYLDTGAVMQTAPDNNVPTASVGKGLGAYVGQSWTNSSAKRDRYKFKEPGYIMDILFVRPVYAWAGRIPYENLNLNGSGMFLPKFNRIGYRNLSPFEYGYVPDELSVGETVSQAANQAQVPAWHEFRSSVDEAHGLFRWFSPEYATDGTTRILAQNYPEPIRDSVKPYFVYQRGSLRQGQTGVGFDFTKYLFCDLDSINQYFYYTGLDQDPLSVSAYYDIRVSSLVQKQFATDLSSR